MIDEIESDLKESFDKAFARLARDLQRLRTGRASAQMLEPVMVEYYGAPTPITQVASVKIPDPRLITVEPWEKNIISDIERAIHAADLGVAPSNDGNLIRIPIPALTKERRGELAKKARALGEDARISLRNARRDANDLVKGLQKDGEISEDEMHRALGSIQDKTNAASKTVDTQISDKEQEIMAI